MGYKQIHGIDFSETFAPFVKLTIVRVLLVVAAMQNWIVCQMDVRNAFLNGDLDEFVYMKLPLGYEALGSRISATTILENFVNRGNKVYRLKKALYELCQEPRQ